MAEHHSSDELEVLLTSLRVLMRAVDGYRRELVDVFDLGHAEYLTITELMIRAPLRAIDIQARTGLAQGSVTALLDRLEQRGLIARQRPPENKRTLSVTLTPAGLELGERIREPVYRVLSDLVDGTTIGDPVLLAADLTHIAHAITQGQRALPERTH
jgi:DNA-binding MarR family transcriptional regulator